MSTLLYSYTYSDFTRQCNSELAREYAQKAQQVIEEFKKLRGEIFKLRYDAEQINLGIIDKKFTDTIAEFNLIMPVIQKLSESAEFISKRELADWERENENILAYH